MGRALEKGYPKRPLRALASGYEDRGNEQGRTFTHRSFLPRGSGAYPEFPLSEQHVPAQSGQCPRR
jgi:hypothetical protein